MAIVYISGPHICISTEFIFAFEVGEGHSAKQVNPASDTRTLVSQGVLRGIFTRFNCCRLPSPERITK